MSLKFYIACPSHYRILQNSFTPLKVLGGLSSHISLPPTFTECPSAIQSVLPFLAAFFRLVSYNYIPSVSCHGSTAHFFLAVNDIPPCKFSYMLTEALFGTSTFCHFSMELPVQVFGRIYVFSFFEQTPRVSSC